MSLEDERAVEYIEKQNFVEFLNPGETQHAIVLLTSENVAEIPPLTDARWRPLQTEVRDDFIKNQFHTDVADEAANEYVKSELTSTRNDYVRAWKMTDDLGNDIVVGFAKPQTLETGSRRITVHSEARLVELLRGEAKVEKTAHLWLTSAPCDNCGANVASARSIVQFARDNKGMKLHLHHDDVIATLAPADVAADFARAREQLSGLNDFSWTASVDFQAEMRKLHSVRNEEAQCKCRG